MGLNTSRILSITSNVYLVIAPMLLIPAIVSLVYKEFKTAVIFSLAAILLFVPASIIKKRFGSSKGELTMREGMLIIALTWLLFPFLAAFIFLIAGASSSYVSCLFEAVSGITTTGATVLNHLESLPKGLLFFRSMLQWAGGLGFLATIMILIPITYKSRNGLLLGYDPARLGAKNFTIKHIVTKVGGLYLSLSAVVCVLLLIGGMSVYDAVVHTFGCVSTGGFSSYEENIFHFHSDYIYSVIFVFMFICSISYMLIIMTPKKRIYTIFIDSQVKLFTLVLVIATVIICLDLMINSNYGVFQAFKYSCFESLSIMSTSGYNVTNYNTWPEFSKAIIFILLFIGGCAGSTAGGIKIFRLSILLKLIKTSIGTRLHPNAINEVSYDDKSVGGNMVSNLVNFIFLYVAMILAGTLAISFDNFDIATNMSASASCIGNIGPGFNMVAPFGSYSVFSGWSKCVLSFLMICGRLELFWVIGLFSRHFWNPNR